MKGFSVHESADNLTKAVVALLVESGIVTRLPASKEEAERLRFGFTPEGEKLLEVLDAKKMPPR